jgi:hypothetical protein
MKFKAKTPIQRIGIILMMVPLFVLFLSAIFWNLSEETFIYRTSKYGFIERSKPQDNEKNYWYRINQDHTWYKIDKACDNNKKAEELKEREKLDCSKIEDFSFSESSKAIPSKEQLICYATTVFFPECVISQLKDELDYIYTWHLSVGDFLEEFFESVFFLFSLLPFIFGTFLWSGWAERLKVWIKTGE